MDQAARRPEEVQVDQAARRREESRRPEVERSGGLRWQEATLNQRNVPACDALFHPRALHVGPRPKVGELLFGKGY